MRKEKSRCTAMKNHRCERISSGDGCSGFNIKFIAHVIIISCKLRLLQWRLHNTMFKSNTCAPVFIIFHGRNAGAKNKSISEIGHLLRFGLTHCFAIAFWPISSDFMGEDCLVWTKSAFFFGTWRWIHLRKKRNIKYTSIYNLASMYCDRNTRSTVPVVIMNWLERMDQYRHDYRRVVFALIIYGMQGTPLPLSK